MTTKLLNRDYAEYDEAYVTFQQARAKLQAIVKSRGFTSPDKEPPRQMYPARPKRKAKAKAQTSTRPKGEIRPPKGRGRGRGKGGKGRGNNPLWRAAHGMADEAPPAPRAKGKGRTKIKTRISSNWTDRVCLTEHGLETRDENPDESELHFGYVSEALQVPPPTPFVSQLSFDNSLDFQGNFQFYRYMFTDSLFHFNQFHVNSFAHSSFLATSYVQPQLPTRPNAHPICSNICSHDSVFSLSSSFPSNSSSSTLLCRSIMLENRRSFESRN